MLSTLRKATKRAFKELRPENELTTLEEDNREYLWALLRVYGYAARAKKNEVPDVFGAMFQLAADAERLAQGFDNEVFGGSAAEVLSPVLGEFAGLPDRLYELSSRLKSLVPPTWKKGQQHKIQANRLMATASEFVKMRLGKYLDAELAELFQQIVPQHTGDDMKDAIRKNRAYMKKNYPIDYAAILEDLRSQPTTEVLGAHTSPHAPVPDYYSASSLLLR